LNSNPIHKLIVSANPDSIKGAIDSVFIENPLVRPSKSIPPIINLRDYKQATFISNGESHNISLEMKN
jgi:hypothetical protein